jgi:predicted transcriptional regulator
MLTDIDAEAVDKLIRESTRTQQKQSKQFGQNTGTSNLDKVISEELREFNKLKPIIDVMCSKALKERHWRQIKQVIGADGDFKELSLHDVKNLLNINDLDNMKLLKENIDKAKKQDRLENILADMQKQWTEVRFELKSFKDSDIPILVGQNIEAL